MPMSLPASRLEMPVVFRDASHKPVRLAVIRECGSAEYYAYVDANYQAADVPPAVMGETGSTTAVWKNGAQAAMVDMIRMCLFYEINASTPEQVQQLVIDSADDPDQGDARMLAFFRASVADPQRGMGERTATANEITAMPNLAVNAVYRVIDGWADASLAASQNP